jgi:hypothetical protein
MCGIARGACGESADNKCRGRDIYCPRTRGEIRENGIALLDYTTEFASLKGTLNSGRVGLGKAVAVRKWLVAFRQSGRVSIHHAVDPLLVTGVGP